MSMSGHWVSALNYPTQIVLQYVFSILRRNNKIFTHIKLNIKYFKYSVCNVMSVVSTFQTSCDNYQRGSFNTDK